MKRVFFISFLLALASALPKPSDESLAKVKYRVVSDDHTAAHGAADKRDGATEFDPDAVFKRDGATEFDPDLVFKRASTS
ncbi:hypothetical protein F4805DRAFT_437053 [Annulohypoxylon moriforme]|nr:hypothetical protein F4805DRAFT_437053 [Annulohypoxylon moriforme]